jgi:hypothetical protein
MEQVMWIWSASLKLSGGCDYPEHNFLLQVGRQTAC